jgi:hypothetical protein
MSRAFLYFTVALSLVFSGCGSLSNTLPVEQDETTTPVNYIKQTDEILGISFSYPLDFTATTGEGVDAGNTTILKSGYSITDNPSGAPGNKRVFPFEISIKYVSSTKQINLSNELAKMVPGWKEQYDAYKAGKEAKEMKVITVGGKEAYRFQAGAEGTNVNDVLVKKNEKEYVVIHLSYIGNTLSTSIKPKPISEAAQLKIFDDLLKSFTFTR